MYDRFYMQIQIPFTPTRGMKGLPPLKNTVQVQVKCGIDASPLPFLCQTPLTQTSCCRQELCLMFLCKFVLDRLYVTFTLLEAYFTCTNLLHTYTLRG